MNLTSRLWLLGAVLALAFLPALGAALPAGFQDVAVYTSNIDQLTSVRFAPDGHVFLTEKFGIILIYDNLTDTTPTVFADLQQRVHTDGDRGLLSVAIHPNFPATPYVYALYAINTTFNGTSLGGQIRGRLSRFTYNPATGVAVPGSETVLFEGWCHAFPSHSVADLLFAPDGMLYVSGGEGANYDNVDYGQYNGTDFCNDPPLEGGAIRSQDLETGSDPANVNGAVLRVDPLTGAAAPGNPFFGNNDSMKARIIAYGLRNPYRLTQDTDGSVWIADNGWSTWEEINRIRNATDATVENFGWPCYEGAFIQPGYDAANIPICEYLYANGSRSGSLTLPTSAFNHGPPDNASSSTGIAFYRGTNYPAQYNNALFFADFAAGFAGRPTLYVLLRNASGQIDPATRAVFSTQARFVTDLQMGPDGYLYYTNWRNGVTDEVRRIVYSAPTAQISAAPRNGSAPLSVSFNGSNSTDFGNGTIVAYAWDLDGDGQFDDGAGATAQFVYAEGVYTATLKVTDNDGFTATTSVTITANGLVVNTPPVATIAVPPASLHYVANQVLTFQGTASDAESGTLPPESLTWDFSLLHCQLTNASDCHAHPLGLRTGVASGTFIAAEHEYPSSISITLRAAELPWWNVSWSRRMAITMNQTFNASLTDYPLLVTLNPTTFDYGQAKVDGSDLRFLLPDGTVLAYEIESWNATGTSTIWVKVPALTKDSFIYLYWGNVAAAKITNPAQVWTNNFLRVYHLTNGTDAVTGTNAQLRNGPAMTPGVSGPALAFDGVNDFVETNTATNLNNTSWSISLWAKLSPSVNCVEFDPIHIEGTNILVKGWDYRIYLKDTCFGGFITSLSNGTDINLFEVGDLTNRNWHAITYQWDASRNAAQVYFDGVFLSENLTQTSIHTNPDTFHIGGNGSARMFFNGSVDETRIQTTARSAAWIAADVAATRGSLTRFGAIETVALFQTPLQSVTTIVLTPLLANLTVQSTAPGTTIAVYGVPALAPSTQAVIQNASVTLSAPLVVTSNATYDFASWSDGILTPSRVFVMPLADASITAQYTLRNSGNQSNQTNQTNQTNPSWWDSNWPRRMNITINTTGMSGAVNDFPIPVTLSSGTFDYASARPDGADLRFVVNGAVVPHEIETWQPAGTSVLWVRIPLLDPSNVSTASLALYFGNPNATAPIPGTAVWSNGQLLVHHFVTNGTTAVEASGRQNGLLTNGPAPATGVFGPSLSFDGINDYVDTQYMVPLNTTSWSISLWAKLAPSLSCSKTDNLTIEGKNVFVRDWDYRIYLLEDCSLGYITRLASGGDVGLFGVGSLADRQWHNVVYQWDKSTGTVSVAVDGAVLAQNTGQSSVRSSALSFRIGGSQSTLYTPAVLDEVVVSNVTRSPAWILAAYRAGTGTLVRNGPMENFTVVNQPPPLVPGVIQIVNSTPGATVFLKNISVGVIALDGTLTVSNVTPMAYVITVALAGFLPVDDPVTVHENETIVRVYTLVPAPFPWWNASWSKRYPVNVNATSGLTDFPVPITLTPTTFDYNAARADGGDIRVLDANNVPLPVDVEQWQPGGTSVLWVKVPVTNGSTQLWLYTGNSAASAGPGSPVWSNGQVLVHHLTTQGTLAPDASGHQNGALVNGPVSASGVFGAGVTLDGINDYVDTQYTAALNNTSWSVSLWAKLSPSLVCSKADNVTIEGKTVFVRDWDYRIYLLEDCSLGYITRLASGGDVGLFGVGSLADRQWHNVVYQWDKPSSTTSVYIDGVLLAQNAAQTSVRSSALPFTIGSGASSKFYLPMTVDEVVVSSVSRSAAWLAASYRAGTQGVSLIGAPETP